MKPALEIIGWWMLLSCTLGPLATWMLFYGKRRRRAARHRWMAQHPDIAAVPPHIFSHISQALFQ